MSCALSGISRARWSSTQLRRRQRLMDAVALKVDDHLSTARSISHTRRLRWPHTPAGLQRQRSREITTSPNERTPKFRAMRRSFLYATTGNVLSHVPAGGCSVDQNSNAAKTAAAETRWISLPPCHAKPKTDFAFRGKYNAQPKKCRHFIVCLIHSVSRLAFFQKSSQLGPGNAITVPQR